VAAGIQELMDASPFHGLHGERVIDKFLMFVGAPTANWRQDAFAYCDAWIEVLPGRNGDDLRTLAQQVSEGMRDHPFFTHQPQSNPR
jgi:hypothetical protein